MPTNTLAELLVDLSYFDDRLLLLLRSVKKDDQFISNVGIDSASRRRVRDTELRKAARVLMADGCTNYEGAKRLSDEIVRFRSAVWPRLLPGNNIELSPSNCHLRRAFLVYEEVPSDAGYLYQLLF